MDVEEGLDLELDCLQELELRGPQRGKETGTIIMMNDDPISGGLYALYSLYCTGI